MLNLRNLIEVLQDTKKKKKQQNTFQTKWTAWKKKSKSINVY